MSKDKFLRSKKNNKCLTSCVGPGEKFFHPILLNIGTIYESSCAVYNKSNENDEYVEECNLNDNKTHIIPDELKILLSPFYFDDMTFLRDIYHLETFDQVIIWT